MTFLFVLVISLQSVVAGGPVQASVLPPKGGSHDSEIGGSHAHETAPVDIVLYSDFQCPYCAQFAKPFRELATRGIDGVPTKLTFKHFPLAIHPAAPLAHQAAEAARNQGKFWEMHDLIFASPRSVQRSDLVAHAKTLGLDIARFETDLDSERIKKIVADDVAEGTRRGVNGTPTYTINGKSYSGTRTFAQLRELIAGERLRARALAEITDDMMSRGSSDAPVTIELFADLQSPVSKPALDALDELLRQQPSSVRLQFRNFPLAFHPQAALAHEAAMTAAKAGRFWEFASYVLEHQDSLREQDLIALAGKLGLDEPSFAATLRERRYAPRVEADLQAGRQRGIRGSPVVIVNGKRIDGVPAAQQLLDLVNAALAAKPAAEGAR
jgi:protein-disulfide isomerase